MHARLHEFLQPTATINSHDESVRTLALKLSSGLSYDEEIAAKCFFWVRDTILHSSDHATSQITCSASEVLRYRTGFCYSKSHLQAALLRALKIPAALCYQRVTLDKEKHTFCLHGLVAIHLKRHGWYRVDPRGDKQGITTDFCPPTEKLAFSLGSTGESDVPGMFTAALECVTSSLKLFQPAEEVALNFPDLDPAISTLG